MGLHNCIYVGPRLAWGSACVPYRRPALEQERTTDPAPPYQRPRCIPSADRHHLNATGGAEARSGSILTKVRKLKTDSREIRAPNLLIWSQTRCHCAIPPLVNL